MLSIGLMSGTSMDGIDAALIDTDGKKHIKELGEASYIYDPSFKILLKAAELAVRKFSGNFIAAKNYYPQAIFDYLQHELDLADSAIKKKLKQLSFYLYENEDLVISFDQVVQHSTELHAMLVKQLLHKMNYGAHQIDVIGYHGQTLLHRPAEKITVQIGDGKLLTQLTGITVVNDFRSNDVAHGGQGAPFAPLYHQALAVRDKKYPVVIVNCGGIANITVVIGETDQDVFAFDTGPGNGLIDRYVKQRTHGQEFMDKDGQYGSRGKVNEEILNILFEKAVVLDGKNYFGMMPPKSLDIGDLILIPELDKVSLEDACATLEVFTAKSIVDSVAYLKTLTPKLWILAGGGWNNPIIYRELKQQIEKTIGNDIKVMKADELGWNSQSLEAQIFAYLAVRCLQNLPISLPTTTRVPEPLSGGRIHYP